MAALARLPDSARFRLRFLCAAWLAGSAAVLRLFSTSAAPVGGGSAVPAVLLPLAGCAAFGVGLLWRTRASGIRELAETSAAFGFWTGVFALLV